METEALVVSIVAASIAVLSAGIAGFAAFNSRLARIAVQSSAQAAQSSAGASQTSAETALMTSHIARTPEVMMDPWLDSRSRRFAVRVTFDRDLDRVIIKSANNNYPEREAAYRILAFDASVSIGLLRTEGGDLLILDVEQGKPYGFVADGGGVVSKEVTVRAKFECSKDGESWSITKQLDAVRKGGYWGD